MEHYCDPWAWLEEVDQIPFWATSDWQKAKDIGIAPENPFEVIDLDKFQEYLVKLKKISTIDEMPAYRAMVILGKLGLLK